eukprot:2971860-Amphidinium_carterae.1
MRMRICSRSALLQGRLRASVLGKQAKFHSGLSQHTSELGVITGLLHFVEQAGDTSDKELNLRRCECSGTRCHRPLEVLHILGVIVYGSAMQFWQDLSG